MLLCLLSLEIIPPLHLLLLNPLSLKGLLLTDFFCVKQMANSDLQQILLISNLELLSEI